MPKESQPDDFAGEHQQETAAHPDSVEAYVSKGWSHIGRGEFDQAIGAFEQALSLDSHSMDAQYGLGAAANAKGDKTRARQAFERAVELANSSPDVAKATILKELVHWAMEKKL